MPRSQEYPYPLISVIIVTYNNEETIEHCLQSLVEQTRVSYQIIVVDNSPDLKTWKCLQTFGATHADLDFIPMRSKENIGFAAGCNLGAQQAQGQFLLFLNPDTCLKNDILSIFLDFWPTTSKPGLLGPQVVDVENQVVATCRNLPTLWGVFLDATGLDRFLGHYRLLRFDHQSSRQVPQIIGACLFTSKEIYEHFKGLDERFFIYFEEVDLCQRVQQSGLKVWFLHEPQIMHWAGVSCESASTAADMIVQLRKSRQLYFEKHFGSKTVFMVAIITILEGWSKAMIFRILYWVRKKPSDLEKAKGFWRVGACLEFWP